MSLTAWRRDAQLRQSTNRRGGRVDPRYRVTGLRVARKLLSFGTDKRSWARFSTDSLDAFAPVRFVSTGVPMRSRGLLALLTLLVLAPATRARADGWSKDPAWYDGL